MIYGADYSWRLPLFIAYILNFKLKGINFFRTAYYIPSLLGGNVAVAVLWRFLFQQDGLINRIIGVVGIQPVAWLSSPGRGDECHYNPEGLAVWFCDADLSGRSQGRAPGSL